MAPHNLATIVDETGYPAILRGVELLTKSAVLYNFEHVPNDPTLITDDGTGRNQKGTFISPTVLEIYSRFRVRLIKILPVVASLRPLTEANR